jgi:glutamyl-tRNA synthetase
MPTSDIQQPTRGRYAPSPTGALHLGNLRTALLAWLFARGAGGSFVLRVEDLDHPRVRPGATAQMLADLRWLGLDWDEGLDIGGPLGPYTQSARQAIYDAALARLREKGLLYPCYCTRAELARIASAPHGDEGPRYPGTCRELTAREQREREVAGRKPALRFRAPETPISFADQIAGEITESVAATAGDFVVRRSDGIVAYQLAVVVDDALMGITQVARGADLLSSTARQLALYDALEYPRPREYAHIPLVLGASGARMAKRDASTGLAALRESGMKSAEILGILAASCGCWPSGGPATVAELLAAFDPARVLRHASVIEPARRGEASS